MKYKTKQKQCIYSYFVKNKGKCVTVNQIKEDLKEDKIGLTTIYRCLEELQQEQVVRKYDHGVNKPSSFQYIDTHVGCHSHYHLQCNVCHTVIHLECQNIQNLEKHIQQEHAFTIDPLHTTFYGICETCADKENL